MDYSINILVVDDTATTRRIVKKMLKQMGFKNIIEAEGGKTALEKMQNNKIGLIISDWMMPGMSGLELLKLVRSHDRYRHIPFLMLTAEGRKQNIVEAVRSGVTNYVMKPFTAEAIKEKVFQVFA